MQIVMHSKFGASNTFLTLFGGFLMLFEPIYVFSLFKVPFITKVMNFSDRSALSESHHLALTALFSVL